MEMELWTLIPGIGVSSFLLFLFEKSIGGYVVPLTFQGWLGFNLLVILIIGLIYMIPQNT